MKVNPKVLLSLLLFLKLGNLLSQDSLQQCRVELSNLAGKYIGECKKGFAHGKGEAIGFHRYNGLFKNGLPNSKGSYYYNDSVYHIGNFQDGLKEGKGETHYTRIGYSDSIVKGYWSGDEFKGKQYTTYTFRSTAAFDMYDVMPSDESGNTITIETITAGSPDGTAISLNGSAGPILTVTELISSEDFNIRKLSTYSTAKKYSVTYLLTKFPAQLFVILSNGKTINLELYKSATWTVRLFLGAV